MKNILSIILSILLLFSFSSCDPIVLAKVSGNTEMGIHLVSIPSCILNSSDLEVKPRFL